MAVLLLHIDADLAGHLAVAVHRHRQVLEHTGLAIPPGLDELVEGLVTAATPHEASQGISRNGEAYGEPMDDRDREWLLRDEVAAMAAVSVSTVDRWIRDGGLRSSKVGRVRRIARADLKDFIERATAA